jgi:hypothetical protein
MGNIINRMLRGVVPGAMVAGAGTAAIAGFGCGALRNEQICQSGPSVVNVVSLSSTSDLALARRMAPQARPKLATVASESCATLRMGVTNNNPDGHLLLIEEALKPKRAEAPHRGPYVKKLDKTANAKIKQNIDEKLKTTTATRGSPLLGTIVAVADQARASGDQPGCTLTAILSDGYAVERIMGVTVDLYHHTMLAGDIVRLGARLKARLAPLRGGTVAVIGAGGDGPGGDIRAHAEDIVRALLAPAGIGVIWSRSADIGRVCR